MNKREQGEKYRTSVLTLLAAVGYASTRQVASGVWMRCDVSARKMAGRTLRRLLSEGLIVCKRGGRGIIRVNNELLFALTAAGAEETRKHGDPLVADKVHARDYLRHSHDHRTACNGVYVAWPSNSIWSELEIRAGRAPINVFKYRYGEVVTAKIPDLIAKGSDGLYEWIEVENSWRSEKDLQKVVECLRAMFYTDNRFSCVHFIVTVPGARTIGSRLLKLMRHGLDFAVSSLIKNLDARILEKHIKVSLLNPETLKLTPVDWKNPVG